MQLASSHKIANNILWLAPLHLLAIFLSIVGSEHSSLSINNNNSNIMELEITKIVIPEDKDSICRFCLKLSNDLIAINDYSQDIKWTKAGNLSIQQVFSKLCLKIDRAECLPNKICDQCKTCLVDFFIFLDKIESNEEILRKVYSEDVFSSSEKDDISNLSFEDQKEFFDIGEIENSSDNVIEYEQVYTHPISTIRNYGGGEISNEDHRNFENRKLFFPNNISEFLKKNPGISIQKGYKSEAELDVIKSEKTTSNVGSTTNKVESKLGEKKAKVVNIHASKKRKNRVLKHKEQFKLEENESICITQCFFCKKKFSNDDLRTIHYLEHVVQATEDMVTHRPFCLYCGLLTDTKQELDEHTISKHQNEEDLNCVDCEIRFSNTQEMAEHVKKQHIEDFEEEIDTQMKCLICKKIFDYSEDMMKHSLEHISRRHTCVTCKDVYICGAALNEHHRTHPQYRYKCPICKKWISNRKQALKTHIDTHNTIRNLECEICKKRYSSKAHYNYHMKSHSRPNNMCPHCGYATKSTKDYVMHLRTHTNERPFKCTFEECGKAYKTNSALSAHVKEHLKIKNFECEFCDYKTSRSVGLTIHRRIHTGEKPYCCKLCGKNFNRQWSLKVHLKKLHPQQY